MVYGPTTLIPYPDPLSLTQDSFFDRVCLVAGTVFVYPSDRHDEKTKMVQKW